MIDTADLLTVFQKYRGESIVVSGRSSRHWVNISTNEKRDVPLEGSLSGGHGVSLVNWLSWATVLHVRVLFRGLGSKRSICGEMWCWTILFDRVACGCRCVGRQKPLVRTACR